MPKPPSSELEGLISVYSISIGVKMNTSEQWISLQGDVYLPARPSSTLNI